MSHSGSNREEAASSQTHVGSFQRPSATVILKTKHLMPLRDVKGQWEEIHHMQEKQKFYSVPQNMQRPMLKRLSREYAKQPNKFYKELKIVNHQQKKAINI